MIESCRIIYAILYLVLKINNNAAECSVESFDWAKHSVTQRKIKRNAKKNNQNNRLCSSRLFIMELLIAEFLIQVPFIHSFIAELKLSIESSKGIYSIFVFSTPIISSSIVANDYLILNQLNKFCRCINIGDLIAILGSIDSVLGSVDLMRFILNKPISITISIIA